MSSNKSNSSTRESVAKTKPNEYAHPVSAERLRRLEGQNRRLHRQLDELRKTQQEWLRGQEKILQAERRAAATQVVVTVSHSINNSLTSIGAALRLIGREAELLGSEARSALGVIQQESDAIERLIQELRQLKQIVVVPYLDDIKMLDVSRSVASSTESAPERETEIPSCIPIP